MTFGQDPTAPGGRQWETWMAERRVAFLAAIGWPEDDPETQQARAWLDELKGGVA